MITISPKLVALVVIVLIVLGLIGYMKIQNTRLRVANEKLQQAEAALVVARSNTARCEVTLSAQNARIEAWKAISRDNELKAREASAKIAELGSRIRDLTAGATTQPLPSSCEEAVRETSKRVQKLEREAW